MSGIVLEENKFELTTQILTAVKWKGKGDKEEREKLEKQIQDFADFLNQDLGNVILQSLQQIHSQS